MSYDHDVWMRELREQEERARMGRADALAAEPSPALLTEVVTLAMCPTCRGAGRTKVKWRGLIVWKLCPTCGGSGIDNQAEKRT